MRFVGLIGENVAGVSQTALGPLLLSAPNLALSDCFFVPKFDFFGLMSSSVIDFVVTFFPVGLPRHASGLSVA